MYHRTAAGQETAEYDAAFRRRREGADGDLRCCLRSRNLKPSPFCLLDEIEAALGRVQRWRALPDYLHKLTEDTQFIIITHRRGTMTAADRLYGITMQEKGVSALVSVNLIEDDLDN